MLWRWTLTILLLAASPPTPELTDLRVDRSGERVTVGARLEGAFGPGLIERVESGLPTGFVYEVELVKVRARWWDSTIARTEVEVVAMYNAVGREYLVNTKQDGKLIASRLVRNLADLRDALTRFADASLLPVDQLPLDTPVRIRARARLGSRTVLTFISSGIETDWAATDVFVVPSGPPGS